MNGKSKFGRQSLVLAMSVLLGWTPVFAEALPEAAADEAGRPSVVGEATRAVVGRVFGVAGDAGDIQYHEFDVSDRSAGNAALRSTLIPGWGQYFNRQRTKGTLFFLTAVGAAAASASLYHKSNETYDDYLAKGSKDDATYDDYDNQRTRALLLGGAAAGLWLISIIDAYRNVYTPLYSQRVPSDFGVVLLDDGAGLTYKKSF